MLAKGETRLELMMKMLQTARHALDRLDGQEMSVKEWDDFWAKVKQLAMRGQEAYRDEMNDLLAFVRELSGGIELPRNLEYLRDFIRTLKIEREIPGALFGAVAVVQIGQKHACPRIRIATLMAMAGASQQYARNDEQALLSVADINALASKHKQFALQAERLLETAHGMVDAADPRQRLVLYTLEVRLVHHIFRKADSSRGSFKTQADIGSQFVAELSHAMQRNVENPWATSAKTKPAASKQGKAAAAFSGVVEYGATGAVENTDDLLRQAGFVLTKVVERMSDKARFVIKAIDDGCVKLADDIGAEVHVFPAAFLEGKFKLVAQEKDTEIMKNVESCAPAQNPDWRFEVFASQMKVALDSLHAASVEKSADLDVFVQPARLRGVVANRKFAKDQIELYPVTPDILMKAPSEAKKKATLVETDYAAGGKTAPLEMGMCGSRCADGGTARGWP